VSCTATLHTAVYRHGLVQQKRMPIDVTSLLMHCSTMLTHLLLRTSLEAVLKIYHKGSSGTASTLTQCFIAHILYCALHVSAASSMLSRCQTCSHWHFAQDHLHMYVYRQVEGVFASFGTCVLHLRVDVCRTHKPDSFTRTAYSTSHCFTYVCYVFVLHCTAERPCLLQ
jgi:hypothetical protein